MTGDLFTKMLTALDAKSEVKCAMIVDNAGSHTIEATQEKLLNTPCPTSSQHDGIDAAK